MIPKDVKVNMTKAQMSEYIRTKSKFISYERREKRLHAKKHYGVRVEVTEDLRKCYVMNNLVVCLPKSCSYKFAFDIACTAVLDALTAARRMNYE